MNGSFKVGDRVRYLNASMHRTDPAYYPAPGTVGTVSILDEDDELDHVYVQWPKGSTSMDDCWWASREDVEPVEGA